MIKEKSIKEKLLIAFFLLSLIFLLAINLLKGTVNYLYYENRSVANRPKLSRESLVNGEYFNKLEEYFIDNFAYREKFLGLGTKINLGLKRPEVNDLYISDNNILSIWKDWKIPYPEEEINNIASGYGELNQLLRDKGINFLYVGVPEHSSIFSNEYPKHLYNRGEEWLRIEKDFFNALEENSVNFLNSRDFLSDGPYDYYSITDHHYSYLGASRVYNEIIEKLNKDLDLNLSYKDLELVKLDKPFKGSYSRKLFNKDKFKDDAYIYKEDFSYTRKDNGERVEDKIFHLDKISDGYYGYDMYMGGDQAFTEINTNRNELPNILVYGDSFTNPLETLLIRNSNNFYSIDFRHYNEKTLLEVLDELDLDIVILVRDNLMYTEKDGNGILY